ncbi:MAG: hypothetical protein ACPL7J_14445, partial [Desulfomonilaceae bacterium]
PHSDRSFEKEYIQEAGYLLSVLWTAFTLIYGSYNIDPRMPYGEQRVLDGGERMSFLTTVLRRSDEYLLALCLENGVVSQGSTKEEALATK